MAPFEPKRVARSLRNSQTSLSKTEKPFSYEIISEKEHVDSVNTFKFNKSKLVIRLNQKIDNDKLEEMAKMFRETRNSYDNLWIFYYLPNMKIGSGAWATTHFTPDLDVKILGATEEQTENIIEESNNVEGEIIGKWKENQYTSAIYVIYKNNGQLIMKTIYPDSRTNDEVMLKKKVGNSIRQGKRTINIQKIIIKRLI